MTIVPVDRFARVDPQRIAEAITPRTRMVSVMLANNEVGTINPIGEIGRITREKGVLFHSDATQGVGKLPVDVEAMNIDLLSLSAHKMYGPKGIGALYVRARNPRVRLTPMMDGGGHERADLRHGRCRGHLPRRWPAEARAPSGPHRSRRHDAGVRQPDHATAGRSGDRDHGRRRHTRD